MQTENRSMRAVCWLFVLALISVSTAAPCATAQPAEPLMDHEALGKLKKGLVEAARKTYELEMAQLRFGDPVIGQLVAERERLERFHLWSRRWLDAQLDLSGAWDVRITAHREHLDRMRDLEKLTKTQVAAREFPASFATVSAYYRIQAELWLEQAKAKATEK